ncbi:MAG: hypothetical protein GY711_20830 [bacterium]|nr:hypothetical protein [bacterium]
MFVQPFSQMLPVPPVPGDRFGCAIDFDSFFVVGAWREDIGGLTEAGAAYVFERCGGWTFFERLGRGGRDALLTRPAGHTVLGASVSRGS